MPSNWKLGVIPVSVTAYKKPWGSQVFRRTLAALPITSKELQGKRLQGKPWKWYKMYHNCSRNMIIWLHSASCSLAFLLHFSVAVTLILLQDPCFGQCGDSLSSHSFHFFGVCSHYVVCLFIPITEWLIFPCPFYGTALWHSMKKN